MSNTMTADASQQAAEAALILASLNRGGTIGVVNIGVSISAMIYGITCIQTFQYYRSEKSKDDSRGIRMLVLVLWLLESAHQALVMHICYFYVILNYANPFALLTALWSIPATILVTGVITLLADGFFIVRIWRVKRNQVLVAICILVAVAHIATNFAYSIHFLKFHLLTDAEAKLKKMGTGALSMGAIKNVIICSSMVWCLSSKTATTKRSADMIDRLIILTVSGGMLTTVFEIATLVAYVAAPSQLYNLTFQIILGKLYINAVLTSLNTRTYIRNVSGNGVVELSPLAMQPVNEIHGINSQATSRTDSMEDPVRKSALKAKMMV